MGKVKSPNPEKKPGRRPLVLPGSASAKQNIPQETTASDQFLLHFHSIKRLIKTCGFHFREALRTISLFAYIANRYANQGQPSGRLFQN